MSAARAGVGLTAVRAMTLVWATSDAETGGALPSFARTMRTTGALVASCISVCTSVVVTAGWEPPRVTGWFDDCTRSWAVAEYCFGSDSVAARLTPRPIRAIRITHHFRRRSTVR